jgi:acetoin utilization deacetylase AcuC-like enzyme
MEIESEENNMARTTIVVDTSIRDRLKKFGVKGETYEDIIVKLMKSYEKISNTRVPSGFGS